MEKMINVGIREVDRGWFLSEEVGYRQLNLNHVSGATDRYANAARR